MSVLDNKEFVVPQLITVGTAAGLERLTRAINHDSLPTIDIEVLLAKVIDALVYKHGVDDEMSLIYQAILELDESICFCMVGDRESIDLKVLEEICESVAYLTNVVFGCVSQADLYTGDFLHYEFARIADYDSLLLRRLCR